MCVCACCGVQQEETQTFQRKKRQINSTTSDMQETVTL